MSSWRNSLSVYLERRILITLLLGFSSGMPRVLVGGTLVAWLAKDGVDIKAIGYFALVSTPYSFKFLWAPLIDNLPPLLPLGRRRGWGITIQLALAASIFALGTADPNQHLMMMAGLATLTAFLSASQDIVIDAYRVELLEGWQQGAGAGATQTGYRVGMMASGAGALFIVDATNWTTAYSVMAALMAVGIAVFFLSPEPQQRVKRGTGEDGRQCLRAWMTEAVVRPFADFMTRPVWPAILIFVVGYKLGEAMAGILANRLYVELGFTLTEIGEVSKVFGVIATLAGGLIGGLVVARIGTLRALLLCGVLQSLGNLAYVLQAQAGHDIAYLALCVLAENITGGMAGASMVAYLSGLCNPAYTATQYALLSSLAAFGASFFASQAGVLEKSLGWVQFFLFTTVATLPALALLLWLMRRQPRPAAETV